jgi:ribose-phosphate pyrophosphokinase
MSITLFGENRYYGGTPVKYEIQLGLYPDNTPVVDLEEAWNGAAGSFKAILVRPNSMQEFFTAMMIVDSIRERGGYVNDLILPCIPGQRQDRMKWEGDWLMTLKFVAKTINGMNFRKVVALDPHSLASGMIDRLIIPELNYEYLLRINDRPKWDAVIAPDAGAAARAQRFADAFGIPVIQASKHRNPETNKLSEFRLNGTELNQLGYGHVIVVDDLCDAGGTFLGLASEIEQHRATVDLFVTHGLFSKGAVERLNKVYNKIYTTNSIDSPRSGVEYIYDVEGLVK